jgi:hypothetical protein
MAANTDTLPVETSTATREASRPPRPRRGALTWAAVIGACVSVAVLGVVTLRGGDDGDTPATRFDPKAEVYEREAHTKGQATTYGRAGASTAPSHTDDRAAQRAERAERKAHLDGLARTYGQRPAPAAEDDDPEFVPGTRHMPAR